MTAPINVNPVTGKKLTPNDEGYVDPASVQPAADKKDNGPAKAKGGARKGRRAGGDGK